MTDNLPCRRCGSTEPRHRISLECKVTKWAVGDRVVIQAGSQAGLRTGTITRALKGLIAYDVEWDERFGIPRLTRAIDSGWLSREDG